MTLEKLTQSLLEARDKGRKHENKFFEILLEADDEYLDLWRSAGFSRFSLYLEAHNICPNGKRYEQYKRARIALGSPAVKKLGVDGAIKAHKASLPTPKRSPRRDYDAMETENRELQAALARAQATIKQQREEIAKLKAEIETLQGVTIKQQREEIAKLKAEIETLQGVNAKLKKRPAVRRAA